MLAGTVTGYAIQYDRDPTPLPPLSQPELRASKVVPADRNTTARSVNANRHVPTDGDLRRLLVKPPKGATKQDDDSGKDGWLSFSTYVGHFEEPDEAFGYLTGLGIRRIARTSWEEGGEVFVTVNLVQFNETSSLNALRYAEGQQGFKEKHADNAGKPIPGSGNGRVYIYGEPHREAGYEPVYEAQVTAQRGDVVVEIWYANNVRPVSEKAVMALAKRQLERL